MKHIKLWLATMAVLLGSITMSAATYSDWTSTNQGQDSSTSSNTYNITASAGDVLTFDWLVSSESNYDKLIVTLSGSEILNKSGEQSGTYQHTFTSSGSYTMVVNYTKDGSVNNGSDYAKVYNIVLSTENSGNSDSENIIASGTCGYNLTWTLFDNGELIINGVGEMSHYGYRAAPWYKNRELIKKVFIEEGVTTIGGTTFMDSPNLTQVVIPESVYWIADNAFSWCSSLTSVIIPKNVADIRGNVFCGCSSLTSIVVEAGNTTYDSRDNSNAIIETSSNTLIAGCSTTVIPKSVMSIGNGAFYDCSNLTSINIPENVTEIGSSAFSGCSNLTTINIPQNSKFVSINSSMFYGCSSLTSITIPENVTSIQSSAFKGCTALKELTIEDGSETLTLSYNSYNSSAQGEGLFYDCPLENVYLGRTLSYDTDKKNGYTPFYEKQSLKSLVVGDKVTSMRSTTINTSHSGSTAFTGCGNLISIAVSEGNTTYDSRDNCNAIIETSSNTLILGCSSTAVPWNTTSIGYSAFYKCSGLTSITLPRNLKTIGTSAFFGCSGLSSIVIPEYVTSVSSSAFSGCTNLKSVVIPASVTSVSYGAFKDCSKIASIICNATTPPTGGDSNTFLNVDKSIPVYVPLASVSSYQKATYWKDFTNIVGVTAAGTCGEGLTWILIDGELIIEGEGAMNNFSSGYAPWSNYGVSKITIKDGVTSIGNSAFYYLRSLTSVSIPESVQTIGANAFAYCERLRSIVIPEGVTTIGDGAFVTCDVLSSVAIPSTLTKVGLAAFANNCRYRSVKISSLEAWCNISFWGSYSNPLDCDGGGTLILNEEVITDLVIPNTVTEIKSMAFCGCDDITSITIPESVKKIGSSALACYPTTIICKTMTPPTCDRYSFTNVGKSIPVYVPLGTLDAYQAADGWSEFANIQVKPATITINPYGSGTYCSEYALDFSEVEGLKAYAATGYDTEIGIVTLTRVMTAKAGTGLFVKGEPGEYAVPVMESTSFNTLNMLVGTLEQTDLNSLSSDGLYANYKYTVVEGENEPLFHSFADGSTLSAGKAYLQIPVAWLPQGEARAISYRFDEGTTSIDEEQLANDNDLPAEIYDLMGRRVAVPQKGSLYIINNEKVIY